MLEALDVIGDENRSIEVSVVFFFHNSEWLVTTLFKT